MQLHSRRQGWDDGSGKLQYTDDRLADLRACLRSPVVALRVHDFNDAPIKPGRRDGEWDPCSDQSDCDYHV